MTAKPHTRPSNQKNGRGFIPAACRVPSDVRAWPQEENRPIRFIAQQKRQRGYIENPGLATGAKFLRAYGAVDGYRIY